MAKQIKSWSVSSSKAYDDDEIPLVTARTSNCLAIYITGINGHDIQFGGRPEGATTDFEDIDGLNFTADGVYCIEIPQRLELDCKSTGGTGSATVALIG